MVKNLPSNAGDAEGTGLIPVSGRSPGGGNGNPPQYSYLGNPMDKGADGLESWGSQRVRHNKSRLSGDLVSVTNRTTQFESSPPPAFPRIRCTQNKVIKAFESP